MPAAIIMFLIVIGLFGGIKSQNSTQPTAENSSGFSVSAQYSNPDTNTGVIPGGVVSGFNQSGQPETTPATPVDTTVFKIENKRAINIDFTRATLEGTVVIPKSYAAGALFFVYSDNQSKLLANTQSNKTYDEIYQSADVKASLISRATKNSNTYARTISGLLDGQTYYYRLCFAQSETVLACSTVSSFKTVENIYRNSSYSRPSVSTKRAEDIQGYSAVIKGNYRLNSAENATAFFVYGESQRLISDVPASYDTYSDVREADENLQKVRLGARAKSTDSPELEIQDLDRNTTYYYRLCVAYDDDTATEIRCGSTLNFTTDVRDRDEPLVRTAQVIVGGTTASFSANIDMQDYNDGHAFLVYGTNQNNIERVADLDRFTRVSQSGNAIQRLSLDVDFDGRSTLTKIVPNLLSSTNYYYRFCVEYEALDDYSRETFFLSCSDTQSFVTN